MIAPVVINPGGVPTRVPLIDALRRLAEPRKAPEAPARATVERVGLRPGIDREGIVAAYRAGEPVRDIVVRFRVGQSTVRRVARDGGIPPRLSKLRTVAPIPAETVAALLQDRRGGATVAALLSRYDVPRDRIYQLLGEHGLRGNVRVNRIAALLSEMDARIRGGELPRTIALDLDVPQTTVVHRRRAVLGPQCARWTADEDAALVAPTGHGAIVAYRARFPTSARSDGGIRHRYNRLKAKKWEAA